MYYFQNYRKKDRCSEFSQFKKINAILKDSESLQDYLDYLHILEIKKTNKKWTSHSQVKAELEI